MKKTIITKEIYEIKNVKKRPKLVNTMDLNVDPFVRNGFKKIRIYVDENYNLTWNDIKEDKK